MQGQTFNRQHYLDSPPGFPHKTKKLRFLLTIPLVLLSLARPVNAQTTEGPNSASTSVNVTLTGSSTAWSNPGNTLTSDDIYATAVLSSNGNFSDHIQITDFGFSLLPSDIVLGIVVEVERFGSNVNDHQIRIIKNGTVGSTDRSVNSSWSNADNNSYQVYGTSTDLWGETWTASDINASNFGLAISAVKQGGGGSSTASVDHVRITVHFDTALPVGLLNFSGKQTNKSISLEWATAWEEDNSHFEIQRSYDGRHFETLGFEPGAQYSDTTLVYHFNDPSPAPGSNYYRLKQHDTNGSYSFSELTRVFYHQGSPEYSLQPTLVEEATTLHITGATPSDHSLVFVSKCGKRLKRIRPEQMSTTILRSTFPAAGVYTYFLFCKGNKTMSGKVLVK